MQGNQKRPFRKIEYSNQTRKENVMVKKGSHQQTTSLNINLKTVTKGYLLELLATNQQPNLQDIVHQYIQDKANFTATRKLFGAHQQSSQDQTSYALIRGYMLGVYENADFVKKILSNQKMDFRTKLLFVKFLERIRKSAIAPAQHKLWKERF